MLLRITSIKKKKKSTLKKSVSENYKTKKNKTIALLSVRNKSCFLVHWMKLRKLSSLTQTLRAEQNEPTSWKATHCESINDRMLPILQHINRSSSHIILVPKRH